MLLGARVFPGETQHNAKGNVEGDAKGNAEDNAEGDAKGNAEDNAKGNSTGKVRRCMYMVWIYCIQRQGLGQRQRQC